MKKLLVIASAFFLFSAHSFAQTAPAAIAKERTGATKAAVAHKMKHEEAKAAATTAKTEAATQRKTDKANAEAQRKTDKANAEVQRAKAKEAAIAAHPVKKDGTFDKRYAANKKIKKDGTPDMRYKENQAKTK